MYIRMCSVVYSGKLIENFFTSVIPLLPGKYVLVQCLAVSMAYHGAIVVWHPILCSLQIESVELALQLLDQSTHREHTITVQQVSYISCDFEGFLFRYHFYLCCCSSNAMSISEYFPPLKALC